MNIQIQEEENYVLATIVGGACDTSVVEELKEKFPRSYAYMIIDFEFVMEFPEDFMEALSDWNSELQKEHILIVAAALNSNNIDLFDSYGVTGIPTVDESVDFVFMDQLEKELGEELD